jgi:hypothetical protein
MVLTALTGMKSDFEKKFEEVNRRMNFYDANVVPFSQPLADYGDFTIAGCRNPPHPSEDPSGPEQPLAAMTRKLTMKPATSLRPSCLEPLLPTY